jgi:transcriptional regulator with XRE-family HTH domain
MRTKLGLNLLNFRKKLDGGISQEEMAARLGIGKSTYASYESDRTEPKLEDVLKFADFLGVSIDDLLKEELSVVRSNIKKDDLRILATTIDSNNDDNIEMVPIKAIGGYASSFGDIDFISKLPVFQVPFLDKSKKYRAFPFAGSSMLPLIDGSIVFGEYVEDWLSIKNETTCIVVTKDEGVVVKSVYNYLKEKQLLVLKSTNSQFHPYPVRLEDIAEIWKFAGFFQHEFPAGS